MRNIKKIWGIRGVTFLLFFIHLFLMAHCFVFCFVHICLSLALWGFSVGSYFLFLFSFMRDSLDSSPHALSSVVKVATLLRHFYLSRTLKAFDTVVLSKLFLRMYHWGAPFWGVLVLHGKSS